MQTWAWAMLGRLLYPSGQHDSWHVIPFFSGAPASGKSTIVTAMAHIFPTDDVVIMTRTGFSGKAVRSFAHKMTEGKLTFSQVQRAYRSTARLYVDCEFDQQILRTTAATLVQIAFDKSGRNALLAGMYLRKRTFSLPPRRFIFRENERTQHRRLF